MSGDGIGLVADIGRQSVRFALSGGPAGIAPRETRSYHTADHATFTSALLAYLTEVGQRDAILPSVLAVAGAARGDLINLTGSRWYISLSGVEAVLRSRPRALNECAATALALTTLGQSAFTPVGAQSTRPVRPGGNYIVVSIGTGLGVAALVTGPNGKLLPIASEAGHMSFSPNSPDEEKFAAYVRARGAVSAETLLSANGLVAAYAALAEGGKTVGSPEEVTRSAGRDPVATTAVRMVAGYLGAFIGNLVLTFGAWEGVYLTGPIARALHMQFSDPRFRNRIEAKDAFRRQLGDVPVAIVNQSGLELMGAAAALHDG
jgi:glucokinase